MDSLADPHWYDRSLVDIGQGGKNLGSRRNQPLLCSTSSCYVQNLELGILACKWVVLTVCRR